MPLSFVIQLQRKEYSKTADFNLSYKEKKKNQTYDVITFVLLKKFVSAGWVSCGF